MKYKLYKDIIPEYSALQQILYNRGIPIEKQQQWLNAGWDEINDWQLFDLMESAVKRVYDAVQNEENVQVVVDCDTDGYTSSAILTNYLFTLYPDWTHFHLSHTLHKGKEHGLSDVLDEILSDTKLVICPDAASNDIEIHKQLKEKGIDVICLDHHEASEHSNDYAITVNPQICDYPNKSLTGAGVTWQFCRAFDELYAGEPHANDFIDLAALGDCGDMADYRQLEIRALCNIGFSNIKNPFFFSMAKKNDYSIQKMNGINYYSMAFYVVPFINAVVRSGTMEEKKTVFDSMLLEYAFEDTESSKRGEKGVKVPLYEEAVTVAERVKRRQTKLQDESMELLENKIEEENLLDNAIILCLCEPGEVEKNISGLCANKIQAKYQKPAAILTYSKTITDDEPYYRGSMRNYSLSPIQNLKDELEKTGEIEFCAGHQGAAGLGIALSHVGSFLEKFNNQYSDIDQTPIYWVDYIWNSRTIDGNKILDIADLNIYGQEIPESLVAIEDVALNPSMVTLMGLEKGHPTIKIQIGDVSLIKFKASEELYEEMCGENMVLTCVCKPNKNEWNGNVSPQLIIEDFNLREEWIF